MNLFDMLTGMGSKRDEYEDFAKRYEQGSPSEGYSDQEVLDRYGSVAHNVSASDYEEAAREAFDRLSPEQRAEFARDLQAQMQTKAINVPASSENIAGHADSGWLSKMTGQLHQQPGLLRELLGGLGGASGQQRGGAGNLLGNPLAKAALAGITAMLVKRAVGRN